MKSSSSNKAQKSRTAVVDKKMKDYGKHPFFVKKTEEANEFIRKHVDYHVQY
jgi:L-lactate utilization protein LutB